MELRKEAEARARPLPATLPPTTPTRPPQRPPPHAGGAQTSRPREQASPTGTGAAVNPATPTGSGNGTGTQSARVPAGKAFADVKAQCVFFKRLFMASSIGFFFLVVVISFFACY